MVTSLYKGAPLSKSQKEPNVIYSPKLARRIGKVLLRRAQSNSEKEYYLADAMAQSLRGTPKLDRLVADYISRNMRSIQPTLPQGA